jgi:hypothetical protein
VVAMLPSLAVDSRYRVATRPLAVPVTRVITAVVRRGAPPRPAVLTVLEALRRVEVQKTGSTPTLPVMTRGKEQS